MPQPLTRLAKVKSITWGAYALSQRPALASQIMQCIAQWAQAEAKLGGMLAALLNSDSARVAIRMYLSINNAETRRSVLDAAASTLTADDYALFTLTMKAIRPVRVRRNEFAHGFWGIVQELPDALLWVSADNHITYDAQFMSAFEDGRDGVDAAFDAHMQHMENIFVYRDGDLRQDTRDSWQAALAIGYLRTALNQRALAPARDSMRRELLVLPLLQRVTPSLGSR